ncbi:MAG: hypothetical protein NTW87_30890 [Planctomycetota bacterium]|nr:hypothetical protein [Planctomycetota bacterium]
MKTKAEDAVDSRRVQHEPRRRGGARCAKVIAERQRRHFKGRPIYTEDDRKHKDCPYPPEPEWVVTLEAAAERRAKGAGGAKS